MIMLAKYSFISDLVDRKEIKLMFTKQQQIAHVFMVHTLHHPTKMAEKKTVDPVALPAFHIRFFDTKQLHHHGKIYAENHRTSWWMRTGFWQNVS